ncbi:hypothetical protein BTS2_3519 [Bacillus sp. TS-2]|nr:hypothetical protein BTS2_3519 [Bacillus sp. TS-2]
MMNYLRSENYRILRKKGIFITTAIGFFLITAAAVVLNISGQSVHHFPYSNNSFFYSNVLGGVFLLLTVAFLFNLALTNHYEYNQIKQSISFGISRLTIFWSKLIISCMYFLAVCVLGLLLVIGLGETLLESESGVAIEFLLASINMIPIILSGFTLIHSLRMVKVGEIYIIFIVLFLYVFSGQLLHLFLRNIQGLSELYKYAPDSLLTDNLFMFMNGEVQLDIRFWIVGFIIAFVSLLIGSRTFKKQSIH